ncbi:MAG: quinone-dependent dihydroorotate dehydrogenase [Nanoarchaeota archaeon]
MIYTKLIQPVLFKIDPEQIHDLALLLGKTFGKFSLTRQLTKTCFYYKNKKLTQTIAGIKFVNPVGLAAGFDKEAEMMQILPSLGFGFEEIGSITAKPCRGNPKPRLWRLPKYKSIVVNYGLKNQGCKIIAEKLKKKKLVFPVGINIAKTNCPETVNPEAGVNDYIESFLTMEPYADYLTINISCPNAYGGQLFSDPKYLEKLLSKIDRVKTKNPVFIKISPELSLKQLDELLSICGKHTLTGFVVSNLIKDRSKLTIPPQEFAKVGIGGLSGKILQKHSDELISYIYQKTKGKYVIIGSGGIFTAKDAYEKIIRGASLLQLLTGMIYEGPAVIKKINKGLVELLKKDGFENIAEAVGSKYK